METTAGAKGPAGIAYVLSQEDNRRIPLHLDADDLGDELRNVEPVPGRSGSFIHDAASAKISVNASTGAGAGAARTLARMFWMGGMLIQDSEYQCVHSAALSMKGREAGTDAGRSAGREGDERAMMPYLESGHRRRGRQWSRPVHARRLGP